MNSTPPDALQQQAEPAPDNAALIDAQAGDAQAADAQATLPISTLPPSTLSPSTINACFPVVGIGASAGGLEAIEGFLQNVPAESGMAFIVVQHLDPTQKCMLPEILQRATAMKVILVTNHRKVSPNCVYVIPPNKDLTIKQGALNLHAPAEARGHRLPIDRFFRSLADDQRELSVGIILSGMGADGAEGIRAIKEQSGITLVQDITSSKFDSMPRSAIATGKIDIIAPVEELSAKLIEHLLLHPPSTSILPYVETRSRDVLPHIMTELHHRTGHDFSRYKKSCLGRRIERRMVVHQLAHLVDYAHFVQKNPQELDLLFKELLIGVTQFFRDQVVWSSLIEEAIPALLRAHPDGATIRAWVCGCASGEEAYSLAIAFKEVVEKCKFPGLFSLRIFATDLDSDAISKARQGLYPRSIAANVSAERLSRFFIEEGNCYRICKSIREMITFAPQNIIQDPPFTKIDILTCRNLMIYFASEVHRKLIPLFHHSLNPGGILVLGSADTIGNFTNLFTPLDTKTRIYRRTDVTLPMLAIEFPAGAYAIPQTNKEKYKVKVPADNIQSLSDQLLLQRFAPAAVLVNEKGDIIYISGRTGKYLEPAAGKANWNIHAMAREGLRSVLSSALFKALQQKTSVTVHAVKVDTGHESHTIDLTVHAIDDPSALRGMAMVVFTDLPVPDIIDEANTVEDIALAQANATKLAEALQQARKENHILHEGIASGLEELKFSNEELQANNEDLQSDNEELQSTNEELTSSREEMQSMNEELQSINAELQSKVEDLSRTSNDMKNLLDSTDIATVFLDKKLNVRRFTNQATQIFKLIASDVGRPLSDIVTYLQYPELQSDAVEVVRTLAFKERPVTSSDGRWFKVRIMPYRTHDNLIDGVVITLSDITSSKLLEAELRTMIAHNHSEQPKAT